MFLELSTAYGDRLGGKGMGLARLTEMGLPVPPAVVVPVDAEGELADPRAVVERLGTPLAVRSSAVGEDATDRSAAGQYESLMGVAADDLRDAVAAVHRSAASDRVRAYRGNDQQGMAVVVQREVRSDRAGVAFSSDPMGSSDAILIEAVFGHGEKLVSGEANPDRYRVGPDGSVAARVALRDGGRRVVRCLRDDEASAVAAVTRRAASGFGHPVDVEFCWERGSLWLVQCRAITTL